MRKNRPDPSWPPTSAIVLAVLIVVLAVLQTAKSLGWF